ncbi:MAG: translocation/assembly module TamB [Bacteroidales bacterium]|nr:translocation/assembly module TamB [Bacteroidales bacterium]
MLLLLFALPATAYLLLQSSSIQTRVASRVMEMVSEKLGTRFTISHINISFLYRIRLDDVYLQDLSGDTIIYTQSLTAGIHYLNPVSKMISIGSIDLEKALVTLAIDSAHNLNLNYFLDKLQGDGKGKEDGWNVQFNSLRLRESRFNLRNFYYHPVEYGMNSSDIRVYDIDADIKKFNPSKDSLSFFIKMLRLKEQGGFVLEKMTSKFSQSKTFMSFRDLEITTPHSAITGNEITMQFRNWKAFKADSFERFVRFRINLNRSPFNLKDIGFFAPAFKNTDQKVTFSGNVSGPLSNFRGRKLTLTFGNHSRFAGELDFEGLPDIRGTFIHADISDLATTASDLEALQLPGQSSIKLPSQIQKLGLITYQGNYTGFINDFVTYGTFHTDLGMVKTDLLFRPDSANLLDFEGKFQVQNFDLGTFLDQTNNMGNISLKASVSGATLEGNSIEARLNGVIEQFEFKQYDYTNINLSGNLRDKTFNGLVNIKDPNIDLEFLGKVNLSDSVPAFDFKANITNANLYALNIDKSDPDFRVSCYLIANAKGNSINTLNGKITLLNSLFVKKDQQLQVYDLSLVTVNNTVSNRMEIRSDFLDADLYGKYELTRVGESLKKYLNAYLPSLVDTSGISDTPLQSSMTLNATLKNTKPLFDFFLPDYGIAENTTVNLTYSPENENMHFHFQTNRIKAKGLAWNNLNLIVDGNNQSIIMDAGGKELAINDRISLENFTIMANAAGDSSGILMRWNNWQDIQYKGTVNALAKINRTALNHRPRLDIFLKSTDFVTSDTIWKIHPGHVSIDSSHIQFDNLIISHLNEFFTINGALSENPDEEVNILFNHFNLGNLNSLSMTSGNKLGGILNGKATISDLYRNTLFTSLLKVDSLMINNEILGNTEINSSWDDDRNAIDLEAKAIRDDLKIIDIRGAYLPAEKGKLAFTLNLDRLRLNLFNPYVSTVFSDLRGLASGKVTLTGTLAKPLLNGKLNLQKTNFTVNYLQTRYTFTEKVLIENNNIYFQNIRIFDPRSNSAYLSGAIRNKYLKDFQLDLTIRSDNFMCLNTSLADNKDFYGTAFATGTIRIAGPPKNITMDISARTEKDTRIFIPLSNTGELNEYPFINIYNESTGEGIDIENSEYQVDLSGMQINFDLEVTPEAEVQIIFDPKLGDKIQGTGKGNLDMKINTAGDFMMFGDYVIEKGDYLFTLQNFINREFTIESGGTIRWDGDPLDATIDIKAYYRTKASLNDLLGTQEDNSNKIWVHDLITMTGKLMSPDVKYDIDLPGADESTKLSLSSAITSADELNRQFISLLIQNRFLPAASRSGQGQYASSSTSYSNAAGVNASEFLSNQLSHMLSQIVNDMDVNINYRSNRDMKSDEVQLALSYQLFNDKLTISGSVDMATNATAESGDEIVGEFDIDYKLTKNGKLRVKTYNHANNDMLYENSPYTQGFGFSYREEFDTFGELVKRYFKGLTGKKEEEPTPLPLEEQPDEVNN